MSGKTFNETCSELSKTAKPCPFCGEGQPYVGYDTVFSFVVQCENCTAEGPKVIVTEPTNQVDIQLVRQAWDKWNKRTKERT